MCPSAGPTDAGRLVNEFVSARKSPNLAVLEGFHPLKHALRFGADIVKVVTRDEAALKRLARRLAPDVTESMAGLAREVPRELFDRLAPRPPETDVIALARRPRESTGPSSSAALRLIASERTAPLVVLERPSHLGNVGAVVRVAAGVGAAGVITSGIHDPWGPDAIRGAAGLQFALPVARIPDAPPDGRSVSPQASGAPSPDAPAADTPTVSNVSGQDAESSLARAVRRRRGPLLVLDPEGEPLTPSTVPSNSIIAFGSERSGLSRELLDEADLRIAIPMRPGVSSLNLATSVAIVLYTWRLHSH